MDLTRNDNNELYNRFVLLILTITVCTVNLDISTEQLKFVDELMVAACLMEHQFNVAIP